MTGSSETEGNPELRLLARAVDRLARKNTSVEARVGRLVDQLAHVTAVLARDRPTAVPPDDAPGDDRDGPPAVRSWLLGADPDQALADLAALIAWLDRVFLRYPDAALGDCWLWHPHVIEELWWLHQAHAEAYHPETGSWLRVGDWHDRQRPAVAKRVRDVLAKCGLTLHTPEHAKGRLPLPAPLAGHAAEIANAWAASGGAQPVPTAVQLDEASTYLRELYRSQR